MNIFKKIFVIISVFAFLFPCEGDTNLDELINIQDIVLTISHILEIELVEDESFSNSDVNDDDLVDILEAVGDSRRFVLKAMEGVEKELGKGVFNNQYEELQEIYNALDKFYKNWR